MKDVREGGRVKFPVFFCLLRINSCLTLFSSSFFLISAGVQTDGQESVKINGQRKGDARVGPPGGEPGRHAGVGGGRGAVFESPPPAPSRPAGHHHGRGPPRGGRQRGGGWGWPWWGERGQWRCSRAGAEIREMSTDGPFSFLEETREPPSVCVLCA